MPSGKKEARRLLNSLESDQEGMARRADAITAAHALLDRLGFKDYDIDELLNVAEFLTRED